MSEKKKGGLSKKMTKRFKDWENRMINSRNDLERYVVLREMKSACESEVVYWNKIMDDNSDLPKNEYVKIVSEASIHISGMNDMLERIDVNLKEYSYGAVAILRAMRNEGKSIPDYPELSSKL